jgi:DNA (cytosine-5)-methyltransferase 1
MPDQLKLTHGSLFAGIGGFDLGFEQAGIPTLWQVENNWFCQSVLRTHFPEANLYGDIRTLDPSVLDPVDIISGGVPCQDWSIANAQRRGLEGNDSGLFFEFVRIVGALRPPWVVFENVPGLLSAHAGRDFAIVLRSLADLGYGLAWRVLDSRFFGVAQRRRRVYLVGSRGNLRAAQVLFDAEGRCGHPEACSTPGQTAATSSRTRPARTVPDRFADGYGLAGPIRQAISSKWYKQSAGPSGDEYHLFLIEPAHPTPDPNRDRSPDGISQGMDRAAWPLLPLGFDGARYRAIGNAVTVPVARWLAKRILTVEKQRADGRG